MTQSVLEKISQFGVVPVIAIDSVDEAIPLADALIEGGLPVAEITFRTAAAAEVIEAMATKRPELLVGAGTVLSEENLKAALDCGAKFGVAPGLNPDVVSLAADAGWPFVPGVATPSDVECGLSMGCRVLKFFPAGALGGVSMLKALSGPYKHTGVRFVPTGGVNAENLESYLSLPVVAAAGGTWIAKQDDLAAGAWQTITDRCRRVAEIVARARS
jgi:2-dehydro-3-deoxyphosphogluconate aldolase/(4S)-4-hydroxy-2-oxoglutarate aldolase